MNKNEKILVFLLKMQYKIEDLSSIASATKSPLFDLIANVEIFFNKSLRDILFQDNNEISTKG